MWILYGICSFPSSWTAQQGNAIQSLKKLVSEVKAGQNSSRHGLGLWEDMVGKGFSGFERPADVHKSIAQGRAGDGGSDKRGTLNLIKWRNERSAWVAHSWECWWGLSGCWEDHCPVTSYSCTSALCVSIFLGMLSLAAVWLSKEECQQADWGKELP